MKKRIARAAALLAMVVFAGFAPLRALAQILPPLPTGSLIVAVTSPASGSMVSNTIPVDASVTIVGSLTVQNVDFFVDGNFIGSDSTPSPSYSVSWNTRTVGNGSHNLTAVARDVLGVLWTSNPVTVTVSNDTTPPTVTINQAAAQADPTNAAPINFTAVFSEPVSGFTGTGVTIGGTAGGTKTVTLSGGPSTYNVAVSGMSTAGTVIATIAAGVAQDAAGNLNTASTSTDNTVTFDTTPPTVTINQAAGQADPTNAAPINFTAVFSKPVSGFTGTDVTLGGTAGGTKTVTVTGGPSTYTVAVSGMTTAGTVIASIAAGVAQDAAGNLNTASTSTDNSVSFDATAPTVSITSPASGASVSGTITVTASASDNVGVVGVQFQLDGVNAGAELTAAPYSVPWNTTTSSNGSHTIAAIARDAAGNRMPSAPVTVTVDNVAPTVTINQASGQADPTNVSPINFTVVFSEAVSGFTGTDVTLGGTAGGTKTVTVSGGPSTYTVAVSGMTTAGTVIASIPAGVARDAAGNPNTASTSTDNSVTFNLPDTTPPTVTINQAAGQADPTSSAPINSTVVFSEPVSGFTGAGVTISGTAGGTKTVTVSGGPSTYTVAVSGMTSSGTVIASIPAGVAQDAAGNTNTASTSTDNSVTFNLPDTTPPTVAITSPLSGATVSGTTTVTASASDAGGVRVVQFLLDGQQLGTLDDTVPYEAVWNTRTVPDGSHTLQARAQDTAGNIGESAVMTVTVANGGSTATRFEEDSAAIVGSPAGAWVRRGPEVAAFSGGTAGSSDVSGATATFSFTGTAVSWIGLKCSVCGIATVSIDGGAATSVDTAGPAAPGSPGLTSEVVFTASSLTASSHTMVITVTGTTTLGGAHIIVDAFDVTGGSAATRIEDTDPAVSYTGTWVHGTHPIATSGTYAEANLAGAVATLSFTGTEVRWLGARNSNNGKARVTMDGVFMGEVDTYGPSLEGAVLFTATDFPRRAHTLTIEVTGTSNPASVDSWVIIDAFDVTP